MSDTTLPIDRHELELPATAPFVRITAGVGSASQKTWNIRRPVTLIGSTRPAHIVLHDRDVSNAHCVIVNTGREVLLKDLHTSSGTLRNKDRADLVELHDGDVITVGGTRIQVAIRFPESDKEDSACGLQYVEPTRFAKPLLVRLEFTDTSWRIENAVALIGRHAEAAIRLDHVDVSTRHALLFRFADGAGIFDLGSRTGIGINGAPCSLAALGPGDRVGIGPCMLAVGGIEAPGVELPSPPTNAGVTPPAVVSDAPLATDPAKSGDGSANEVPSEPLALLDRTAVSARLVEEGQDPVDALAHIEAELTAMQRNIADSWDRLNRWQQRLRADAQKLNRQDADIHAREAELDAKDAALRGQLHDLTRYHEQITQRERELAAQLARIQAEQDKLTTSSADLVRREGEIARRNDELQRREHVLAQRWARLLAASCPHCGKPVRAANGEPNATRV